MTTALGDDRRIHQARAALRELLGDTISVAPKGDYLVAELPFRRGILSRADGRIWIGGYDLWGMRRMTGVARLI